VKRALSQTARECWVEHEGSSISGSSWIFNGRDFDRSVILLGFVASFRQGHRSVERRGANARPYRTLFCPDIVNLVLFRRSLTKVQAAWFSARNGHPGTSNGILRLAKVFRKKSATKALRKEQT